VHAQADERLIGALVPVRLTAVLTNSLAGEVALKDEELPA
jgi:hypothetical protein